METQRLLLQIECRKRVVVATVLPEKDRDGTRMLYDLAGNRTELVDYRTQADTLCTDGLVMLQRFVDRYSLIADEAQRVECDGRKGQKGPVCRKVL